MGPDFCAVVVLDDRGRITAGNATVSALWQTDSAEFIGDSLVSLFTFEVVSSEPDFVQAQWEVLRTSASNRDVVLTVQPRLGAPREVRVRIEQQIGGSAGYVATVRPAEDATALGHGGPSHDVAESFALLGEQGSIGFFDLNLATDHVRFSPTWKRLLGYAISELPDTLTTWHELIHPDDSFAAPDKLGKKSSSGSRPFNVEFRMRHQLGHWVWIQCAGLQLVSPQGTLDRVVGVHIDISERKELEDTLVANDARLQDLSEGGPLAAFELDFAQQIFWFSPSFQRLLGHQEGTLEPEAQSFAAALPAEESLYGVEAWLAIRAPGQNTFVEAVTLRGKDGRPVPVLLGVHRVMSRKRELLRVVGFACALPTDATTVNSALPPRLAEEAFNALAEAVIVTDENGKIIFTNPTASRLLKVGAADARGKLVGDIFRLVNRQTNRPSDDPVDRALAADRPLPLFSDDALAPPSEGEQSRPIVWTARAATGTDGRPQGVVIVFRDPEEMTLTPEELVKANRLESLGLLAGGIAHDINNLLTTILGSVSLANDNRDYSALSDAENACLASKNLTKQLLAFARGGVGTQTAAGAKEILEDALKIASAGSSAEITLHVAAGTEPVLVDRAQILQVFQNLIINALQAMPPPPHQARLQIRAQSIALAELQVPGLKVGDYVEFEVRDNGSGIKPEHVGKIFDPFFTTKKHGTGLGLATVLSIVRKHGGQIGLDTQEGVGTAFTVYLPRTDQPIEIQARRAPTLRFGTGRILFMDDDPNISSLTARMLDSLDYKHDLAKNGEEAIALYKRYQNIGRPYDAVIMDLTVVGAMGGEECFAELKKLDPEVRAIVASGYDNDEIARKFLEQGFCGYLTKPYRVTDLGKVLKTVLG